MSELGTILTGRNLGKNVRKAILNEPGIVTVDFMGIKVASHSFCDEAFGKMVFEVDHPKNKIRFKNANDEIKTVIKQTMSERIKEKQFNPI
ncbi:MAG: STAS-like domain-containing protein [Lentimicrobiaceae bacterium]|nr:STAS-like domain-containing protein [Lentimicrobiaceae bacterium]